MNLVKNTSLGYCILWLSFFLVRILTRDRFGWFAYLENFVPIALIPILFFPILAYKTKSKELGIFSTIIIGLLILEYGPNFIPRTQKNYDSSRFLVILTHNMGQDLPSYEIRFEMLLSSGADIILLQEVTQEFLDSYLENLEDEYPYSSIGPMQSDREQLVGMATLSKYPISQTSNFKLDPDGLVFQQRSLIEFRKTRIAIYNIHTTFPWVNIVYNKGKYRIPRLEYADLVRSREIDKLISLIVDEKFPVLLAGDFNFGDRSKDYRKLITNVRLIDTFKKSGFGFGFTWPANRTPSINIKPAIPFIRVDYIFSSQDFNAIYTSKLSRTGSDHIPMRAVVVIDQ